MLQAMMRAEAHEMPLPKSTRRKSDDTLAQLEALLAPPDLSDLDRPLDRARANRRAATEATRATEAELMSTAQRFGPAKSIEGTFTAESREVVAARSKVAKAKAVEDAAKAAFTEAQAFRDNAFLMRTEAALTAAAPLLSEAAEAFAHAIAPLVELHATAFRARLPLPPALQAVPQMQAGACALLALANKFSTVGDDD